MIKKYQFIAVGVMSVVLVVFMIFASNLESEKKSTTYFAIEPKFLFFYPDIVKAQTQRPVMFEAGMMEMMNGTNKMLIGSPHSDDLVFFPHSGAQHIYLFLRTYDDIYLFPNEIDDKNWNDIIINYQYYNDSKAQGWLFELNKTMLSQQGYHLEAPQIHVFMIYAVNASSYPNSVFSKIKTVANSNQLPNDYFNSYDFSQLKSSNMTKEQIKSEQEKLSQTMNFIEMNWGDVTLLKSYKNGTCDYLTYHGEPTSQFCGFDYDMYFLHNKGYPRGDGIFMKWENQ